jgi:hypothetical protein
MTSIWQETRVCTIAALIMLYAPMASAQASSEIDPHKDHHSQAAAQSGGDQATKPMGPGMMAEMKDMAARLSALDARVNTLVADMNMFTGELKISAMASLLAALAERDKLTRDAMMHMHDMPGMACSMMKREAAAPHP